MTVSEFAATLGGLSGDIMGVLLAAGRDRPAVVLAGLLALIAVSWTVSWRLSRGVVTIAHEGATRWSRC